MAPPSKPPSLSSLQAALRKSGGTPPVGQKRAAEEVPVGQSAKKMAAVAGKVPVKSAPAPPERKASGLSAKMMPGAPPGSAAKSASMVAQTPPAKAPGTVVKKVAAPPPEKRSNGLSMIEEDGSVPAAAVTDFVASLEAASGSGKVRMLTRLADSLGQKLPIEHINHFLKALKRRVHERAATDGVRVPTDKTLAMQAKANAAAAAAKSSGKAGAASVAPVSAAVKAAAQTAKSTGAAPKAAKASVSKSAPGVKVAAAVKSPGTSATGKAAIAKAAVAKVPAKASPKAAVAKVAAKPPPKAATDGNSLSRTNSGLEPPASPPPDEELAESDPLYVLVGELAADPVVDGGSLKDDRLHAVFKRLWDGIAKKPKDWVAAWHAMVIPVELQAEALQKFLNMAFVRTDDPEKAPLIVAQLVQGFKVKMRSVEEVLVAFGHNLDGILALNEEAWHVYAYFLTHVFPKPSGSGWGWSRVGWSWSSWWQFVEKCVSSLEGGKAFDVIAMILRLIQDKEGTPLSEVQGWSDGDKLTKVTGKLSEVGTCSMDEVVERLGLAGVATDGLV